MARFVMEELRLEVGSRFAQDLNVFEYTHQPVPEPPRCGDGNHKQEQADPRPTGNPTSVAGGLHVIGPAPAGSSGWWR